MFLLPTLKVFGPFTETGIIGVHAWMQEPEFDFNLLSFLVSSVPVDKLFPTIFEAEQFGRSEGGRGGSENVAASASYNHS